MERAIVTAKTSLIVSEKCRAGIGRAKEDSVQIWGWLNQPSFSVGTKENYERITRNFFNFHWNIGLKEITTPHITLYLKSLDSRSDATQNLNRATLSSLFRHLEVVGYLSRNPVTAVKSIKISPDIEGKILPVESVIRMIQTEESIRNKLLLKTLYLGAFRESEVIQLKPSSFVELPCGRVKASIIGKGKKPRIVHLPESLWTEIKEFIAVEEVQPDEYIFSPKKRRNQPICRKQVFVIVKAAAKKAAVYPIPSPHWFRHMSSTHAYENGAPLKEIQETLGHSSIATTQIYLGGRAKKSNSDYLDLV